MKTSHQESSSINKEFSKKVFPILFPTAKPITRTKSISVNFQRNLSELPKVLYQKAQEILDICQYNYKRRPSQASFVRTQTQASVHYEKDSVLGLTKDSSRISPERKRSPESRLIDDEQKKVLYIKLKKTLDGKFVNKSSGPTFNEPVSNKTEMLNKIRVISNSSELKNVRRSPVRPRGSICEERTQENTKTNGESSPRSLLNDCTITTIELGSMDLIDDRALDLTMGSCSPRETSIDLTQRESSPVKKSERTSFPLIRSNSDRNLRKISLKKPIYAGYNFQVVRNQKSICLSSRPNFRENKSAHAFGALDRSASSKLNKNSVSIGPGNISYSRVRLETKS